MSAVTRRFVLRSAEVIRHMAEWATERLEADGEILEADFKPFAQSRSLAQNRRAWWVAGQIAQQVVIEGRRFSQDAWWTLLKRQYWGPEFRTLPDGSIIELEPRSRTRDKKAFTGWIEYVDSCAAEHGVTLPEYDPENSVGPF